MSEYKIRISVRGLFFNDKDELLLIKSPNGDYWATPGGGLESTETLTEAAERELLEETGYVGVAESPVYIQDYIGQNGEKHLQVFFRGRVTGKSESITPDHTFKCFSREAFSNIKFKPDFIDPFDLKGSIEYRSLK